jgi:hypothetical protein
MAQVAVCTQTDTKHINTVRAERTVVKMLVHHVTSRLQKVNVGFLCFRWKFRLFLWPHFHSTWVRFWRVGSCISLVPLFNVLTRVLQFGYAARPWKGSGFDLGQDTAFSSSSLLYNGYRDCLLEVRSWREPAHSSYVFTARFVIGHKELQV